jgi:hypothetical protein
LRDDLYLLETNIESPSKVLANSFRLNKGVRRFDVHTRNIHALSEILTRNPQRPNG